MAITLSPTFTQKNNIIRDIREDLDDGRRFWPREIWSKHVDNFEDLFDPKCTEKALDCSSDMIMNALEHACNCLSYLAGLREQSVFKFCAIPQAMALATLELSFRNTAIFERNIKITKGDALQLMIESSQDLDSVKKVFCRYARRIQKKGNSKDPNFLRIRAACEELERFAGSLPPSSLELAEEENSKFRSTSGWVVIVLVITSTFVLGVSWLIVNRFPL